jgi:hypothetical protein
MMMHAPFFFSSDCHDVTRRSVSRSLSCPLHHSPLPSPLFIPNNPPTHPLSQVHILTQKLIALESVEAEVSMTKVTCEAVADAGKHEGAGGLLGMNRGGGRSEWCSGQERERETLRRVTS